jgi:hypothetical protein
LYRLAVEHAAPGDCFNAVAEGGIQLREIAEVIGDQLDVPTRSLGQHDVAKHFGWFARFVSMDVSASSDITRARLGWSPQEPDLLTDLREHSYFEVAAAGAFGASDGHPDH